MLVVILLLYVERGSRKGTVLATCGHLGPVARLRSKVTRMLGGGVGGGGDVGGLDVAGVLGGNLAGSRGTTTVVIAAWLTLPFCSCFPVPCPAREHCMGPSKPMKSCVKARSSLAS